MLTNDGLSVEKCRFVYKNRFVTPENLRCSERFITEVVGVYGSALTDACDFGLADVDTCTPGCADRLIPWAEDCAHVDGMIPSDEVVNLANYLLCCFKADEQGNEYTCPTTDYVDSNRMISPNCDGGQTSVAKLGDGNCDTELDCGKFQQDFGDCEVRVNVDMPFTISGAITEHILLMVLTDGVNWMSPDDIEVVSATQTIIGTIDITEPSVNSFSFSNNAAASQLKQGFKYWLGLPNTRGITFDQPCDLTSSGQCQTNSGRRLQQRTSGTGVRIGYTIVAAKDAAATMFGPNNGASELAAAIARAPAIGNCPDVLPACLMAITGTCNNAVIVANPTSITTIFVLRMSVTEQEFENAMDTTTDTSYQALQTAFTTQFVGTAAQATLQTALQAELANGVYGGMTVPSWAASATLTVPASDKDFTFQADARRPPPPEITAVITEKELAALVIVFIIILVLCTFCACGVGVVFFSRRSSKVVIMDEQGNIISTFETKGDAENLEGEVLQKMLQDHIAKTQLKFQAKQEAEVKAVQMQAEILAEIVVDPGGDDPEDELDALIAAPVADTQPTDQLPSPAPAPAPEQAELDALVGAGAAPLQDPADQESLTDAYKRDVDTVLAKRQASRAAAQQKLEERRAAAAAKQKKALVDAGVDAAVADQFIAETETAQSECAAEELEQEAAVDAEEASALSQKKAEFDVAMAGADSDEAKADLTAAYQADQTAAKAALASKRASQKDALQAKLAAKKAAMLAQQKAKVEEVAPKAAPQAVAILEAEASPDLMGAYKNDVDAVMQKRQASRVAAQQKLAERRAKAAAQQKKELANTGVDVAIVEEIAAERAQADADEATEVLKLEADADAEESAMLAKEKAELVAKAAAAADDTAKAALTAEYQEDTKKARADLDAKRSAKRDALQKKLEAKKAAMREKEKQKLGTSSGGEQAVAVLESQNASRDAGMKAMLSSMKGKKELAAQQAAHEEELAALKSSQEQERAAQEAKIAEMTAKFEELQNEKHEEEEHEEATQSLVKDMSAATEADKTKMEAQKAEKKAALQARLEKRKEEKKRKAAELLAASEM